MPVYPITVEVDIIDSARDEVGITYDVAVWYVNTLPEEAVNPLGAELLVEAMNGETDEEIRDRIRLAAITLLETATPNGYNFPPGGLTIGNVRVEGYSNEGFDGGRSPFDQQIWYGGAPFRVNIPTKTGYYLGIWEVSILVAGLDSTVNPDIRKNSMTLTVNFESAWLPNSSKVRYSALIYNEAKDTLLWQGILPITGSVATQTWDLLNVSQDALWDAGKLYIALSIERLVSSGVEAFHSGKILNATVEFARTLND